ncbi:translation initiation factor IF-2-like [Physeter macrocephalus]|uniref:Translation initiation factor IF-2-like n=1 Tax=Physeter macrocephalus TaxID=9755 RepID=A0A9W2WKE3_PHYMC|nr:translation initiation factor IF-2-like [Physeter catodon]
MGASLWCCWAGPASHLAGGSPRSPSRPPRRARALRTRPAGRSGARGAVAAPEEPSALVPAPLWSRRGRAPARRLRSPRADAGRRAEGSDVAAASAAASARSGPTPDPDPDPARLEPADRPSFGGAMAERGCPLEAVPLPAEVRESLAELELELSEVFQIQ